MFRRGFIAAMMVIVATTAWAQFDQINLTFDLGSTASNIVLNDLGDAIFLTSQGIHRYHDGVQTLQLEGEGIHEADFNDLGQIAYVADGEVHLVYIDGTDRSLSERLDGPALHPSLNNLGQVAFESDGEIYFFAGAFNADHEPLLLTITSELSAYASYPSINDLGQIAFQARENGETHIYLYDGISLRNITESLQETLPDFGRPSLNNAGHIAFERRIAATPEDILLYDGFKVRNLSAFFPDRLARPVLNDQGHLVCENRSKGGLLFYDGSQFVPVTDRPGDASPGINNHDTISFERSGDVYLARPGQGALRLDRVEPTSATVATTVTLNLEGGGFVENLSVDLGDPGIQVIGVYLVDSAHATAVLVISPDAHPGNHSVTVWVPGGQSSTLPDGFEVFPAEEPLRLIQLSPDQGEVNTQVTATLTGTGFVPQTQVSLGDPGIEITSQVVDETRIQVTLNITAQATPGSHHVTVITPGGQTATLFDAFSVVPQREFRLLALTPDRAAQGDSLTVRINGEGFVPGTQVRFDGEGISAQTNYVSESLLEVEMHIAADAPPGERDVIATHPDGNRTTFAEAFTVVARREALTLESLDPSSVVAGSPLQATVTGSGFVEGAQADFNDPDIAVSTAYVDAGHLAIMASVSVDAAPGTRDLIVSSPEGYQVILKDALNVLPAEPSPSSSASEGDPGTTTGGAGDELPQRPKPPPEPLHPEYTEPVLLTDAIQPSVFYPDLNNLGQIIAHNTSRGLFLYSGGTFQHLFDGNAGPSEINDWGQVVFEAQGVLYWLEEGQVREIGPGEQPSLNNRGQVAFKYRNDVFLFHGFGPEGPEIENLTSDLDMEALEPSLNDAGWVAFAGANGDIYLYDGTQLRNLSAENNLWGEYHHPVLNNQGQIAFVREDVLYLYDGTEVQRLVSDLAPQLGRPCLNDQGQIVFDTESQGRIFLYEDGSSRELTANFPKAAFRPSLNNRGEVAFYTNSPGEIYLMVLSGESSPSPPQESSDAESPPTEVTEPSEPQTPEGTFQLVLPDSPVTQEVEFEMTLELDTKGQPINGIDLELERLDEMDALDAAPDESGVQPFIPVDFLPEGTVVLNRMEWDVLRYSVVSLQATPVAGPIARMRWKAPAEAGTFPLEARVKVSFPDGTTHLIVAEPTSLEVEAASGPGIVAAQIQLQGREDPSGTLEVVAVPQEGESLQFAVEVDATGQFQLELPAGTYDLFVRRPGYLWASARSVQVEEGTVEVDFDNGVDGASSLLLAGDINGDNAVDLTDFASVASAFGLEEGYDSFPEESDFNGDGVIGLEDFSLLAANFGRRGADGGFAAPAVARRVASVGMRLETTPEGLQVRLFPDDSLAGYAVLLRYDPTSLRWEPSEWGHLVAPGRVIVAARGPVTVRFSGRAVRTGVRWLSGEGIDRAGSRFRLQPSALPERHELLPNYPNPFNPETWIPYRLAEPARVRVQINSLTGQPVRTFDLGVQPPGDYTTPDRALHWDGRNQSGEPVSSGLYFYTLQAGNWHATRRLVVMR